MEFAARGGMIHYTYQLCRGLAAAGVDVTLLTDRHYELDALPHPFCLEKRLSLWDPRPAGPRPPAWVRVPRRALRAVVHWREWARAIAFLLRRRFDVVQLGDLRFASDLVFVLVMRALGVPLVGICHNVRRFSPRQEGGAFRVGLPGRLAYRWIYRLLLRVVVHFEVNRDELLSTFGVPPERVVVIRHGNEAIFEELRDAAVTRAHVLRRLGWSSGEKVVMFFGSLSHYKGVDLLLEAFARAREGRPCARLAVLGQALAGFDDSKLVRQARDLGIEGDVRFEAGYVSTGEVAAWIEAASVVVFPYRDVHQSGALHVAQTLGAPLVATDVGAMSDVVKDRVTGLLVPPGDVDSLAQAIGELLDDEALARRLGEKAARDARERFSWEGIGRELAASYAGLEGGTGAR